MRVRVEQCQVVRSGTSTLREAWSRAAPTDFGMGGGQVPPHRGGDLRGGDDGPMGGA